MEVFAHYDIVDTNGNRVAEGLKASFCLEDSACDRGVFPKFDCQHYGQQGKQTSKHTIEKLRMINLLVWPLYFTKRGGLGDIISLSPKFVLLGVPVQSQES